MGSGDNRSGWARLVLASTPFWAFASVAWFAGSSVYSCVSGRWEWFQRSGSVLTVAGLVMAGRSMIREGGAGVGAKSPFAIGQVQGSSVGENGQVRLRIKHSPETLVRWREEDRDATAAITGLVLAVLGTIVWGYGDLAGNLFSSSGPGP